VKLNKKNKGMLSRVLVWGAVISVLFSIVGWMGSDIWLASTQWLLVAAVSTLFAIYLKMSWERWFCGKYAGI